MDNVLVRAEPPATPTPTRRTACQTRVAAAVAGDREAFAEIYEIYLPAVRAYLWRRSRDRDLVDDLTSETFARALMRIQQFIWTGTDIGAWLVTIARNLLADHFRAARRSEQPVPTWIGWDIVDVDPVVDPFLSASRSELAGVLAVLLARLTSPGQEECLRLRFLEDLSVVEAAARLGVGVDACKALQHRAVRSLNRLANTPTRRPMRVAAGSAGVARRR
jgi:RNA polymerase sigma-70 factor (ECF subfamily)